MEEGRDISKEAPNKKHTEHLEKICNMIMEIEASEEVNMYGLPGLIFMRASDYTALFTYVHKDVFEIE